MEEPIDEALTKDKENAAFTPIHKERTKVVLYPLKCTVWGSTRYPPLGVVYKIFEAHRRTCSHMGPEHIWYVRSKKIDRYFNYQSEPKLKFWQG